MTDRPAVFAVFILALSTLFAANSPACAQADQAHARKVVAEVNQGIKSLRPSAFSAQRPDADYRSDVRAWSDTGGVRKIEVTDRDDSGDVVTEYYYEQGRLIFSYLAIKGFADSGRQVTRVEQRQYFRDGEMFRWLGGMDKVEIAPASETFTQEAQTRLAASVFYLKAAQSAAHRKVSP